MAFTTSACASGLMLALVASAAFAQEFPNKPIRVIAPFAAGSASDLTVRVVAGSMGGPLGQPVIVENRTGASGLVAYEFVAKQAPADGYTIALGSGSLLAHRAFTVTDRFDALKDLPPFTILTEFPQMIGAPASAGWKSLDEMAAFARANPGKLNFGVPGVQTPQMLVAELIKQKYGIDFVVVPYRGGGGEINTAVLANQVQMAVYVESMAQSAGERVRLLGVSGARRLPAYPGVPLFSELGLPEITNQFNTLNARVGTPRPVIDRLYLATKTALEVPEVRAGLTKLGLYPVGSDPDSSYKTIEFAINANAEIARRAGIKPQ